MQQLYIAFSSDDNYVQHLAVALVSLLENNRDFDEVRIFILSNGISPENKKKLQEIGKRFICTTEFIEIENLLNDLKNKYTVADTISISSYARLFLSQLLDTSIDKIVYADCDSIFLGSLKPLFKYTFATYSLYGVKDHVGEKNKIGINMEGNADYINAGFLFISLEKWRVENSVEKMIHFISERNGKVIHNDQGVINGCFHREMGILPACFNVMTSFYDFKNVKAIQKYYGAENYYTQTELNEAKRNPVFLHLTPGFSKRPWIVGSRHPLKQKYWEYLQKTPWKDAQPQKDTRKLKYKLIEKFFWIVGPEWYKKVLGSK